MGMNLSLFEWLRNASPQDRLNYTSDQKAVGSVLTHLENLLNSRQGDAQAQPDYGIPEECEFMLSASNGLEKVCQNLQWVIKKFEPRLREVRVTPLLIENSNFKESQMQRRFEIKGILRSEHNESEISFASEVLPSGRIRVDKESAS